MSVIWHKVWFDLWHNKIRTLLAVVSIAVGVFAIGATFGMADQISPTMDAAHEASAPAHITLVTSGIDLETATRLKKIGGVAGIDLANAISVRYKIKPEDEWASGELLMRDYEAQSLGLYQLKAGEWPERKRLSIERLSSQYFGLAPGDQVILEINDKERSLPITGKVRHPFVNPPEFGGPAVFFGSPEVMELFEVPKGKFNQLMVRVAPYSDRFAREIASEIKNRLAKEGIGVGLTIYQGPDEHPGRSLVEGINVVLQLLAVVSLGASVVLVLNTLTALITQQTDQIGIIKAIGGRTSVIIKIYLAEVVVYGLLSLVLSLPLGAWLAFGLSRWMLNIFNIEYQVFRVSSRAIVLQVMAAIGVPLLAALWPVLTGAALSVREAVASYGLGGDFGSTWLDRVVEQVAQRLLRTSYALAVGNLFRRKGRLLLTQLVLMLAGTMFLTVMSLSASVTATLDKDFAQRRYDATIFFKEDERINRTVALAESLAGVERAEVWYSHSASILKAGQRTREAGFGTQVIGIPAGSDLFQPLMVGGRWLRPDDGRTIVINSDTADDNDLELGAVITLDFGELGDSAWQVVGFFNNMDADSFGTDPIYANLEAVFRATKKHNRGNQLYIQTQDQRKTYVEAVLSQLEDIYNLKNMDTDHSETLHKVKADVKSEFDTVILMLLTLAIIMALVGGIGLMGSLSISVVERTREIGVMRAIGARTPTMLGMFMLEGILQGLLSWAMAMPLSFIVGQPMARALGEALFNGGLFYQYDYQAILIWFGAIVIISALASILPARNAVLMSVRESLAYA
jgi:putative ABC transport system permease protein